jgi:uncharacterized membrane protein YqjE
MGTSGQIGSTGPIGRVLESARHLLATLLTIGRTRLELLTVEVQLEIRRTAELVVWLLVAVQSAMIGLIMAAFLLIVVFWDTHRLLAACLVTAGFFALALGSALTLITKARRKPPFLAGTLAELGEDSARLRERPAGAHEP